VKRALVALLLLAVALFSGASRADERILSFESLIKVGADGKLDVTEDIRVRAEGNNIRRGIYRDFPTRYTDRYGNRVVVDFKLIDVLRDGHPTPHFTEDLSNGVRINTGDDSFLPVPAEYTFTIHYQVDRELGFFEDHDELYWNVTGLGWSFPIDNVLATVQLPAVVPEAALRAEAYTGPEGAKGGDYETRTQPGIAQYRSTRALGPNEGLTLVLSFPKGVIAAPSTATRLGWILKDNRGVLIGLAGFALLAAYYFLRWLAVGRDPQAGPIFPQYEPPANFSPAELRTLWKMGADRGCFTAELVDMAVRGFLRIHGSERSSGWRLEKVEGANAEALTPSQRVLAAKLFEGSDRVELDDSESSRFSGAISAHAIAMSHKLQPRYYQSNYGIVGVGAVFSILVAIVAGIASNGHGVPVLVALGALAFALHITAAFLLRAPTLLGRKLLDQVEGLRMYLDVAERDELKMLRAPDSGAPPALDAKRYEALLPYAMALEVEDGWTKQFIAAVGMAAAAQSQPSWYQGAGSPMGIASVGHHLASNLESQVSSASTPPGSSSGSGGGGFSGGGGGGGGGGGR